MDEKKTDAMNKAIEPEEKMRAGVVVHPKTGKQKIIFVLMILTILTAVVPVISIFNKPILIFGMPLFMFWCLCILFFTLIVMRLAYRWEVH